MFKQAFEFWTSDNKNIYSLFVVEEKLTLLKEYLSSFQKFDKPKCEYLCKRLWYDTEDIHFYNYNKSNLERLVCIDFEIKCNIEGEIYYNFIPTPRLVIKNLKVYSSLNDKNTLAEIEKVEVIIPVKDLYKKSKDDFNKIILEKAKLYIDYEKIDQYKTASVSLI